MWLLQALSTIATLALRVFYRFRVDGLPIPRTGPVLLVANHPNSLLDPAAVAAAAARPVRFMAKAPLFSDPSVGWMMRAAGAIPVYRKSDDPALMERNEDSFRAVFEALRGGDAVGIFPEGLSHSEPSLAPLKTGAARIALGAADGLAFPIVPVGLSLREKWRFRSEALALRGAAVEWEDLAPLGAEDAAAVRELTRRIEQALRSVTVNLRSWEDAPLVEIAGEVYLAEEGAPLVGEARIAALREVAAGLERVRIGEGDRGAELVREVRRHARMLQTLDIRPHQLAQPARSQALRWAGRSMLLLILTAPVGLAAAAVFFVPYQIVRAVGSSERLGPDLRATYKILAGTVVYLVWGLLLSAVAGWMLGGIGALVAALGLPLLGILGLLIADWRSAAGGAVRRFLVRRRRTSLIAELRGRQSALARRLAGMREALG